MMDEDIQSASFSETFMDLGAGFVSFLEMLPGMRIMFEDDPEIGYSPRGNHGAWTGVTYRAPSEKHFRPQAEFVKIPVTFTLSKGERYLIRGGFLYVDGPLPDEDHERAVLDPNIAATRWLEQMNNSGFHVKKEDMLINPDALMIRGESSEHTALLIDIWVIVAEVTIADPQKAVQAMIHGIGDKTQSLGMGMLMLDAKMR